MFIASICCVGVVAGVCVSCFLFNNSDVVDVDSQQDVFGNHAEIIYDENKDGNSTDDFSEISTWEFVSEDLHIDDAINQEYYYDEHEEERYDDEDIGKYSFMGAVIKTNKNSFQGALYCNTTNEIYQILDHGHTMVLDATTLDVKREFDLPCTASAYHFSSVDWLDENKKVFLTSCCQGARKSNANDIYVYDISDENHVSMTILKVNGLSSKNYSYMLDIAYDKVNKILYAGGYGPNDSSKREYLYISAVDFKPYLESGVTKLDVVGQPFKTAPYHLQDGTFYNGKIYYLTDNNLGASSPHNNFAIIEIDPQIKDITRVYSVELEKYEESESMVIVPGSKPYCIMSYWDGKNTEYYYKMRIK